uniref:Beta-galactosidase 11 n=1 Tax=Zea mays TaxID=4577 RepID=A0A804PEM5_MAIZE
MYSETVPKYRDTKVRTKEPLEQYNQTKDDTDYLWYTTRYHSYLSHLTVSAPCHSLFFLDHKIHLIIFLFVTIFSFRLESDDLPFRNDIRPVLQVKSSAHAMMGFANDAFVGNLDQLCNNLVPPKTLACCMNASKTIVQIKIPLHVGCARRNKQVKGFMFEKPVDLKVGVNHVVLLSSTMGMKDSGGELAEVKGGIQECLIQGLNTGTLDLQVNGWGHKAALEGEYKEIYSEKVWAKFSGNRPRTTGQPLGIRVTLMSQMEMIPLYLT